MNDGDGMFTMEAQARQIMENATKYNGSSVCPTCGVIMNPVEFMSNKGHCMSCLTARRASTVRGKMA